LSPKIIAYPPTLAECYELSNEVNGLRWYLYEIYKNPEKAAELAEMALNAKPERWVVRAGTYEAGQVIAFEKEAE